MSCILFSGMFSFNVIFRFNSSNFFNFYLNLIIIIAVVVSLLYCNRHLVITICCNTTFSQSIFFCIQAKKLPTNCLHTMRYDYVSLDIASHFSGSLNFDSKPSVSIPCSSKLMTAIADSWHIEIVDLSIISSVLLLLAFRSTGFFWLFNKWSDNKKRNKSTSQKVKKSQDEIITRAATTTNK